MRIKTCPALWVPVFFFFYLVTITGYGHLKDIYRSKNPVFLKKNKSTWKRKQVFFLPFFLIFIICEVIWAPTHRLRTPGSTSCKAPLIVQMCHRNYLLINNYYIIFCVVLHFNIYFMKTHFKGILQKNSCRHIKSFLKCLFFFLHIFLLFPRQNDFVPHASLKYGD